ncbi:MAG: DoxX family protein [Candidatus Paceibacterota bacterium]|jgi:uncharacterized membrane protein YphA (DoxX/SURF4 family)
MQNAFPYILSWSLLAPFILRLVAGSYFIIFGYRGLTSEWWERFEFFGKNNIHPTKLFATGTAVADLLGGFLLIMGFGTQIVALSLMIVCFTAIAIKAHGEKFPNPSTHIYFLLSMILATLFITGSGFFGMDLPL